ncbi:MAG: dihydropteroate synthase [Verrucomicrobium sp.]|jgi:dihydropteroate synthase|nr:dihydropteroate synthase [Verrucomicrobium sp.]
MELTARQHRWTYPRPAQVMGILNVTPDSFSDGGHYLDAGRAVERAQEMLSEGAEFIDIGGESTRPGAAPVDEAEELRRVIPVVRALAGRTRAVISVDTRKAGVARAALDAGASLINDVEASRSDPELWRAVASVGAGYVLMHMQGRPETMQAAPAYGDVVAEVGAFFRERLLRLQEAGVRAGQVLVDPGIGFGKSLDHNLRLMRGLGMLSSVGRPILLGVSRKSFIGRLFAVEPHQRLGASLACAVWAAGAAGASVFRVHDVAATVQALRMREVLESTPDHGETRVNP